MLGKAADEAANQMWLRGGDEVFGKASISEKGQM